MARGSSQSRSRSPGPWRARDRGGVGPMALVGPPPSRMRGNASSRTSRVMMGEQQHEKVDSGHRGLGLKGRASDEDFYSSRGSKSGGIGGADTQKQHASSRSWQQHAGGGGRGGRNSGDETGDVGGGCEGDGDGGAASRKGAVLLEGRGASDSRRMRNNGSNRRPKHRGDTAHEGGGSLAAPTYHGYGNDSGTGSAAAAPYDKRSANVWKQRRDNHMHAGSDDAYTGGGVGAATAAVAPGRYEGGDTDSRAVSWGGDRSQHREEAGNSYYHYYHQGSSSGTTVDAHHRQQQYGGGLTSNGAGSTRLHRPDSNVFEAGAGPTGLPRGTAAGGGGAAAGSPRDRGGQGEDMEDRLLDRPLLSFKQFVVMKPDDCTQKELSQAYEAYVERHKKFHAEQFFEKHGGDAFMRELYHPNLRRRQHDLRKARAKMLAQAFLQQYQDGYFSGLTLEADSEELRHFYSRMEEDSPLLLEQWISSTTIFSKRSTRREEEAEVVEVEDDADGEEVIREKRDDVFDEQQKEKDEDIMQDENQHPHLKRTSSRRRSSSSSPGNEAAAAEEAEAAGEEEEAAGGSSTHNGRRRATAAGRTSHHNKRWPPYVLLPSAADCLVIHAVDPWISSLEIYDELASQGVADVAMVTEGDNPTDPRTAFVFFSSSEAKRNYQQKFPDMIVKLTKPVVTAGADGEEQETLKVFSLSLREPPPPSSSFAVFVTPPAACMPSRMRRDLETSAALIIALDRQMGVFEEELNSDAMQHPLLSSFPANWNTQKRLDMQITYLRHVHSLCYYSGELCRNLVEVNRRCHKAHLRPRLPAAAQQAMYLQLEQQQKSSGGVGEDIEGGMSSDEEDERRRRNSKSGNDRGYSSSGRGGVAGAHRSSSGTDEEEDEQQQQQDEGDMDNEEDIQRRREKEEEKKKMKKRNQEIMSCVARPQQRWLRQLDRKLLLLLKKIERMQEDLPAALEEETPIISLKWNAFCHEKVFEDDEHKHRCRLCNKPFKAPHFVFKHLRKKHEEELNFIIERYATIVMKEAYMKDEGKPLMVMTGTKGEAQSSGGEGRREEETSVNAEEGGMIHGSQYPWGYGAPLRTPPAATMVSASPAAAGGWPAGAMPPPGGSPPPTAPSMPSLGVPSLYGTVFMPERSLHAPGIHPIYAGGAPGGGAGAAVITTHHPVAAHPPSQYYPFGGGVVPSAGGGVAPPHVVYGGGGVGNYFGAPGGAGASAFRRRDWDAPEPVVAGIAAPLGGVASRQVNGARSLASYADL